MNKFDENEAIKALENGYGQARKVLYDADKLEKTLQKAEQKLKKIPKVGDVLAYFPIFVSIVRSYISKEYTEIPVGTIIAVLSAIIYVVVPIDIIPDWVPMGGYVDDAAVIAACVK